jgi:hypothetical protein
MGSKNKKDHVAKPVGGWFWWGWWRKLLLFSAKTAIIFSIMLK